MTCEAAKPLKKPQNRGVELSWTIERRQMASPPITAKVAPEVSLAISWHVAGGNNRSNSPLMTRQGTLTLLQRSALLNCCNPRATLANESGNLAIDAFPAFEESIPGRTGTIAFIEHLRPNCLQSQQRSIGLLEHFDPGINRRNHVGCRLSTQELATTSALTRVE